MFKKSFLVSSVASIFLFSNNALAFDQFLTVKFKKNVSQEQIQELNKMTNTKISKNLGNNSYKLKINGVANQATLDKYAEMFLIMKDVEEVSPLPKEKVDDKINPFFYMNITPQQEQPEQTQTETQSDEKGLFNQVKDNPAVGTVDENELRTTQIFNDTQTDLPPLEDINGNPSTNNQQYPIPAPNEPQIKTVPNELVLKYHKGVSQEDIDLLNMGLGGSATYNKETDTYNIKLPDYVDDSYAMSFYNNNQLIDKVSQNTIKVTPQAKNSPKGAGVNIQSGVAVAIPLNGRDVKVTFKIGKQNEGLKWFENAFGAKMVSKKGFQTFNLRFPANVNPKFAARAVKASPIVQSAEVVSD